jgi:apolipoprotein N-acyltransferase
LERAELVGIGGVARWCQTAMGWRRAAIAFGAGSISTVAFAPYFAWPILFVTFPVLVWLLDGAGANVRPRRAAAIGLWWFAFGYFFFGLMWIGEAFLVEAEIFAWLLPFAVTALPAGLSLFWALAGAIMVGFWRDPARDEGSARKQGDDRLAVVVSRVALLAVGIGLAEYARGSLFTGLPWNVPGIALTYPLAMMQAAGVFGIYGLTVWAVWLCALPAVLLARHGAGHEMRSWRQTASLIVGLVVLPLVVAFGLGSWRLAAPPSPPLANVKVRIVQPSVPQRDKWIGAKQGAIFADHIDLSRRDASGRLDDLAGITHVLWPEAAMPFGPLAHPEALAAIGQMLPTGATLLAGALRSEGEGSDRRAYNSLLVLGAGGTLVGLYDKIHLVPFGEYLPFQSALEAIGLQSLTRQRGGFARGTSPKQLLAVPGLPLIGPMICYEAIFPGETGSRSGQRPGLLVIVTNDGWFGNSTGPPQHFHQARIRAVEQGMSVLRAANNGISAVVDPEGRVMASLNLNVRGSIESSVLEARAQPLYAQYGDSIFALLLFSFCLILLALRWRF